MPSIINMLFKIIDLCCNRSQVTLNSLFNKLIELLYSLLTLIGQKHHEACFEEAILDMGRQTDCPSDTNSLASRRVRRSAHSLS